MAQKKDRNVKNTSQRYLPIAEIRENTVVLKDGSLRAVLLVSSINFSLKSVDEQNAIVSAYMSFLNSIDFFIEIVVQSRKIDMDHYLAHLKELAHAQNNELLRMQTMEYRNFISELIELGDIMTKRFYIVIPYHPLSDSKKGFWRRCVELFSSAAVVHLLEKQFFKRKRELDMRLNHVISSLNSIGLKAIQIDTQGLVELYYRTYNPEMRVKKIPDLSEFSFEE